MAEESFDFGRKTFESWPWMFGYQWFEIQTKVKEWGIMAAQPEILLLTNWCSIYMTEEELKSMDSLVQTEDWRDLHRALNVCMRVAQRERTWKFANDEMEELTLGDLEDAPKEPARTT